MGGNYIVLGVDRTILNLEPVFFLRNFNRDLNKVSAIKFQYLNKDYLLAARPRLTEFLENLSKSFILIAYSEMPKYITKAKLKMLGIQKYFKYVLGSECLIKNKKSTAKIAEGLNINPKEIIMIDSSNNCIDNNILKLKPFMIGKDINYEFEEHQDNLFGVLKIINQNLNVIIK